MKIHPINLVFPVILFFALIFGMISLNIQAGYAEVDDSLENSEVIRNHASVHELSASYPPEIQKWQSHIIFYSHEAGLDPNLIAALIFKESGGDPNVISSSGAVGLMQIMPCDGIASKFECVNGPCFADRPPIRELIKPEFNLHYGIHLLSRLIERTNSVREALRLYGPFDVDYSYADIVLGIRNKFS